VLPLSTHFLLELFSDPTDGSGEEGFEKIGMGKEARGKRNRE
jgi:hypothetical protein